jgi:ubiquinone/menaquinone biosynthesis C-methylase UbiE
VKEACAAAYASPAVRWLLGGELHPGGEAATRRALELIGLRPGERLLDVAAGTGTSALLAAREYGCLVAGVEYGEGAVADAQRAADAAGLGDRVEFIVGDAEALPSEDGQFDAVLCECSLCTFADKPRAVSEIRRVLRPDGRLALSDVVVDRSRLPPKLDVALATVACIGEALSREGYEDLLASTGLRPTGLESRNEDAAALAERVHDRLRGARLLGLDRMDGSPVAIEEAIELVRAARRAIAQGSLGYAIFTAAR